jgi:hypothetical protein
VAGPTKGASTLTAMRPRRVKIIVPAEDVPWLRTLIERTTASGFTDIPELSTALWSDPADWHAWRKDARRAYRKLARYHDPTPLHERDQTPWYERDYKAPLNRPYGASCAIKVARPWLWVNPLMRRIEVVRANLESAEAMRGRLEAASQSTRHPDEQQLALLREQDTYLRLSQVFTSTSRSMVEGDGPTRCLG